MFLSTLGWARGSTTIRVRKAECDAFYETGLDELLRDHGFQHLVIAGLVTELCVDSTCRRAVTLGYDLTLVSDGHSTHSSHLPAETIVDHHNRTLDEYGVYVDRYPREIRLRTAAEVDFVAPEVEIAEDDGS